MKSILCAKNKTHPPPCKCKGIYKFQCKCNEKAIYIGETRRSIDLRALEHKKAMEKEKWSHSGLTQHKKDCKAPMEWTPEVLSRVSMKDPQRLKHHLRVEEALWISRYECGPGKGLNEDTGSYVKSDAWVPVFNTMRTTGGRRD